MKEKQFNEDLRKNIDSKGELTLTIPKPVYRIGNVIQKLEGGRTYIIQNIDITCKLTTRFTSYKNPEYGYVYICVCGEKIDHYDMWKFQRIGNYKPLYKDEL